MRDPYRRHRNASVVVQTDDVTLLGDIADTQPGLLTLRNTVVSEPRGKTPMDGLVIVATQRIAWVQVT